MSVHDKVEDLSYQLIVERLSHDNVKKVLSNKTFWEQRAKGYGFSDDIIEQIFSSEQILNEFKKAYYIQTQKDIRKKFHWVHSSSDVPYKAARRIAISFEQFIKREYKALDIIINSTTIEI